MSKEKRYLQWGYDSFKDTKTGEISDNYIHTLNQQDQRIAELEEQLKNAVILEPDHYVIITNGWKNKKYGVALSQQRIQYNYIQETDGRMGCYVPCIEFGKFKTKEEAQAKLEELQKLK